jgi:hypothetical protein
MSVAAAVLVAVFRKNAGRNGVERGRAGSYLRTMGTRWLAFVLAGLAIAVVPASEIVRFTDGRSMRVERVVEDAGAVRLELEGGGMIRVPAGRIAERSGVARTLPPPAPSRSARSEPWREAAGPFAGLIEAAADRHGLEPALLTAMMEVESAFDPRAVSPKGARGLLQLMPATATRFGVGDPFDPVQNVEGGARYLSWLMQRFEGQPELALAGYNAGEGAVDRHGGVPPYPETQHYVARVLDGARSLAPTAP